MKYFRSFLTLIALVLAASLGACSSDSNEEPRVVVREDVHVLGEGARQSLEAFALDRASGAGELRFKAGDPSVASLAVGHIVVTEPVAGVAPHGFLQRVVDRREEGDAVVLTTTQATLEEVFETATIDYTQALTAGDVVSTQAFYEGISFGSPALAPTSRSKRASYEFAVDFDKVLIDLDDDHETKDDQVRIDGKFRFNASAEAKIDIGWTGLNHFRFLLSIADEAEVRLEGALKRAFEKEIRVAQLNFGAFTIMVGPVPVVFTVDMDLTVGAKGQLEAHLVVEASQSAELKLGAEYKGGKWANLSGFESKFDFPTPEISAKASARAFAKPRLGIAIYGLAGPYVFAEAFVEADAELPRDPFWRVEAGLDLGLGFTVKLPIVGKLADWHDKYEALRKRLGDSPNEKPSLELIAPEDGTRLTDGETLEFRFRASDREQEKVDVILTLGGKELGKVSAAKDKVETLVTKPLCVGQHELTIAAKDAKGATDERKISAVVDTSTPRVTLDDDHLGDLPLFPGAYLVAFASASDRSCEAPGNAAEQALIEWYLDDQKLSAAGPELLYRLPSNAPTGQPRTLQARYNNGTRVGVSNEGAFTLGTKPPGTDLPPTAIIQEPKEGGACFLTTAPYTMSGLGIDTEDGKLAPSRLAWKFVGPNSTFELPGTADKFQLSDPGYWTVTLTVTDSAGQTDTKTVGVCSQPPN